MRQGSVAVKGKENTAKRSAAKPKWRFGRLDIPLLVNLLVLLAFGLLMLFSASYPKGLLVMGKSYYYIKNQLQYVAIGIPAMFLVSLIDYRILKKFAWPFMAVSIIMLVVVLFMEPQNKVRRWIWLGSAASQRGFQPSEIAKFAVILLFAFLIAQHQKKMKTFKYGFLPFMMVLGIVSFLLIKEPHLSCTILILGIGVSMMFAGGASLRWFAFAAIVGVVALALVLVVSPDTVWYASDRISTWLNPLDATDGDAWQTLQSLIAVGSGGVTGRGIGQSRQKFLYLPEMFNDYIFAIVSEELGMLGGVLVIILFLLLLLRCFMIALRVKDKFGSMIVVGVAVQIALQAFLHIAVNTNVIPSTGISLPFFSYGGTALCMLLGQMGIVLSVSRRADLDQRAAEDLEAKKQAFLQNTGNTGQLLPQGEQRL